MGPWYYAVTSSQAPTLAQVFDTLLTQQISFNGVLWSIRVEYWMIPLLPLMVLISDRASSLIDIIIIALGCALAACVVNKSLYEPSDLWAVPCWAYCFYLGVALNKIIQSLGRFGELLFSGGSALIAFVLMIVLLHDLRGGLWGAKLIIDGLLSTVLVGWAHKTRLDRSKVAPMETTGVTWRYVLQRLCLRCEPAHSGYDCDRFSIAARLAR